jgi:hypothetical protein
MPTDSEIREEQKKINRLRFLVDFTITVINQGHLPIEEVYRLVDGLKSHALTLFPDKEDAFELIYRPRITRAIRESYRLH